MARRRDGSPGSVRRPGAAPDAPARTAVTAPHRRWLIGGAAIVIGALLYLGISAATGRSDAGRLPALPNLSGASPAVVAHLREKDRAARASPRAPAEVLALCLAYHADMFFDEAERCYARAEELSPADWHVTYYRALAQGERGNVALLATSMRRVVAAAPEFGPAWWRLGEAEFKQARYERAAEAWRRAESLPEPQRTPPGGVPEHVAGPSVSAYSALGLARLALVRGDADQAKQILEKVTSSAPRFGPAFRLLGDSYARLGRRADAERAIRRANGLPIYAPYVDPLVDALALESHHSTFLLQQAVETDLNAYWDEYLIGRALAFDPNNPDIVYKLGGILRNLGRNGEALELFERYQRMVPEDPQVLGQIGSCLGDLGRFSEAESFLRRALERVDDALTHYNLGFVLTREGRLEDATVSYERALARDPNHLEARTNLAAVLTRRGKLDLASRELARVLDMDPENSGGHTNLGLVLAQQGHFDRAAREFQEALRINPQQAEARAALQAIAR
jgi:tetratricopeptide (TPR) repeat protein